MDERQKDGNTPWGRLNAGKREKRPRIERRSESGGEWNRDTLDTRRRPSGDRFGRTFDSKAGDGRYRRPSRNDWEARGERGYGRKPSPSGLDDEERPFSYRRTYQRDANQRGGFQARRGGTGYRSNHSQPPRQRTGDYDPNAKYSKKKQLIYKRFNFDPDAPVRLNKFIANSGICSRREADNYIVEGLVTVNGNVVTELGTKVNRNDTVMLRDKQVKMENKVYILLNKPKDCVTTTDDPNERRTVLDCIEGACSERVYPVGRLDRNTTGVLLLTNDGELASKLMHPKYMKKKVYAVTLDKKLTKDDMLKISEGVTLDNEDVVKADEIAYIDDSDKSKIGIVIHSGQNRVIRRIFESLGYRVRNLDRTMFAGLTKKGAKRGEWRYLTQQEVNMLYMGAF